MKTLHIAPGDSAGGSLGQAIRDAARDEAVLPFLDDLSCGPIHSDEAAKRAAWWAPFYGASSLEARLGEFWDRVASSDERLVVWFGRHSASETAFFLAWADRLEERPYEIVDVTGQRLPYRRQDGSAVLSRPLQCVATMQPDAVRALFGEERPIAAGERDEYRRRWRRLRTENAPFRIVTEAGLASTAIDHFDPLLLAQATRDWQRSIRVIANTMGYNTEPYIQVGKVMLLARVAALVADGRLLADGDPCDIFTRIRLPG